jgi:hypothetical protein
MGPVTWTQIVVDVANELSEGASPAVAETADTAEHRVAL